MSISTCALREEGDPLSAAIRERPFYFYPRPPRGGRQLGLNATQYVVTEYSESNAGAKENMLAWNSDDGVTGIYSDDSGAEPVVKIGVSLDALRELVGNVKEPENSEEIMKLSADYQGEWERVGHEKYERLVVSGNTVNTVLFDTSKDWRKKKTVTYICTFYFGVDEEKGLVVTNRYKQVIQIASINEQGEIELHDKSQDEIETYRKVSDNTDVPTIGQVLAD